MGATVRAWSHNTRSTQRSRNDYEKCRDLRSRKSKSSRYSRSSLLPPVRIPWQSQQQSHSLNTTHISFSVQDHPHSTPVRQFPSSATHTTTLSSEPQHEPQYRRQRTHYTFPSTDHLAAKGVENRIQRLPPQHFNHTRILRNLLTHPTHLDTPALWSILTAVDALFFSNTLRGRVDIEWSSLPAYHTSLIGTTLLRSCHNPSDGIETLIILSKPILQDPKYDRRLLLSAFMHELIHCYLFVKCGWSAREQEGHTDGFHRIAKCIDEWVGVGELRLCSMMANLSFFTKKEAGDDDFGHFENDGYDTYEEGPRNVKEGSLNSDGCVKKGHDHGGCNHSPMYEREYYDGDVDGLESRAWGL